MSRRRTRTKKKSNTGYIVAIIILVCILCFASYKVAENEHTAKTNSQNTETKASGENKLKETNVIENKTSKTENTEKEENTVETNTEEENGKILNNNSSI